MLHQKNGQAKHWNFARLSSKENPLVLFTLSAQAAAGAFALAFLAAQMGIPDFVLFAQSPLYAPLSLLCFAMVAFGLFMSTMHLGKPHRFYRGFNNLRYSPVSREGLGIAIFMAGMGLHILFSLPGNSLFQALFSGVVAMDIANVISLETATAYATVMGYIAVLASVAGLYYMNRCYRIKARPFWNHWQVGATFSGNMFSLGALVAGGVIIPTLMFSGAAYQTAMLVCGVLICLGMAIEGLGRLR